MAEIVNLKRVRKAVARQTAEAAAAANRRKFGRTKAEKADQAAAKCAAGKQLDQSRLDPPGKSK